MLIQSAYEQTIDVQLACPIEQKTLLVSCEIATNQLKDSGEQDFLTSKQEQHCGDGTMIKAECTSLKHQIHAMRQKEMSDFSRLNIGRRRKMTTSLKLARALEHVLKM